MVRAGSRDSKMLVRRCAKPDRKEFTKHIVATSMGFLVMGFIGFFVKVLSQSSLPFRLLVREVSEYAH